MKKVFQFVLTVGFMVGMTQLSIASEHGGRVVKNEHGGGMMKGSGHMIKEPSRNDIRNVMKAYVQAQAAKHGGYFMVKDVDTGKVRRLSLIRVHERIGKTGDYYYSCADFKDVDSGEKLDLDLDVDASQGMLKVVDVRIHKLNGDPRYTYDDNDNRIPLKEETKSHKGSSKEHGGMNHKKEHGGKEHGGN